jgi:hypothetical protein
VSSSNLPSPPFPTKGQFAFYAVLERYLLRGVVPHRPEKERAERGDIFHQGSEISFQIMRETRT